MIRYVFKDESFLTIKNRNKADPQKIGAAVEEVARKANGRLIPSDVVDAARDRRSALHQHFEWNDKIAAEAHRLDQARSLIRCIHLESPETDTGTARAFLSIKDGDGTSYRAHAEVLSSADLQSRVLAAAERDLLAFEARYKELTDICALVRDLRLKVASRRAGVDTDSHAQI